MTKDNPSTGLLDVVFTARGEAKILALEFASENEATIAYNIMSTWEAIRTFILDGEKPIFMFKATINSKSQYEVVPTIGKSVLNDLKKEVEEGEPFLLALMSRENLKDVDKILTCVFYRIVS